MRTRPGGTELLTTEQMYRADKAAVAAGVAGVRLMENAGYAVSRVVEVEVESAAAPIVVLCGPGNNGGDGFVAARHLRTRGYTVRLALLGEMSGLTGDAAAHAAVWGGPVEHMTPDIIRGAGVVVDALFGAGLTRPLAGTAAAVVDAVNASECKVVAVDVPSGVMGDTGGIMGDTVVQADVTVTFFRAKPAHVLYPGRGLSGRLSIHDIGIPDLVLDDIGPMQWRNDGCLWRSSWPWRTPGSHKYRHGHALVVGGAPATGAGRLAAHAALRTGAGLVTAAVPSEALTLFGSELASLITQPIEPGSALDDVLADPRRNAVLIGPGAGVTAETRTRAETLLTDGRAAVLDADALSVFAETPERLAAIAHGQTVLTPHEGEFARLFPDLTGDKLRRARTAAATTGAVVVLKGPDTVVAAPDGRATVADNAPPDLATAGSGDVLAGVILGALAQDVPPFEAASAGVWLLGEAGRALSGPGLISADLPPALRQALRRMKTS